MSSSEEYYRRRYVEELAAAESSDDPAALQIHRELAKHYYELLLSTGVLAEDMPAMALKESVETLSASN